MAFSRSRLSPFWFAPDDKDDSPAEFHIRPLTEPQVIEIICTFVDGQATPLSWLRAAELGVFGVRNYTNQETGKAETWPACKDIVPFDWLIAMGAKAFSSSHGMSEPGDDPEEMEKN